MIEIKLPLVDKNIHDVFLSSSYLKVIEGINAKLRGKDDIIVLTGESGTGKTLIVRQILQDLDDEMPAVFLQNPRYTCDEMLNDACEQIGIDATELQKEPETEKKLHIFRRLLQEQSQDKGPVRLFIDDAHNVDIDTLFNILKLLEGPDVERPLQIILIGLPQLEVLLTSPELAELISTKPVFFRLKPLGTEELGAFVAQRLDAFGIAQEDYFSDEAIEKIALYTRGIPSQVAILFDAVMATIQPDAQKTVTGSNVDEAVDLFSQKKIVNLETARDNRSSENKQRDNKKTAHAPANPEQHSATGEQNGKTDTRAACSGTAKSRKKPGAQNADARVEPDRQSSNQQNDKVETMKMNLQEETSNRGERLTKVLKALQNGSPDVEAVALISDDGLMVASALPQDLDEIRVGGRAPPC